MKKFLLAAVSLFAGCCIAVAGPVNGSGVEKGYRGFVDYTIGGNDDDTKMELLTSHGFQVNPYFFVGGGTGIISSLFGYLSEDPLDFTGVPVFLHLRTDILKRRATPFLEAKYGVLFNRNFTSRIAMYSLGCRIAFNNSLGINISLNVTATAGGDGYYSVGPKISLDF